MVIKRHSLDPCLGSNLWQFRAPANWKRTICWRHLQQERKAYSYLPAQKMHVNIWKARCVRKKEYIMPRAWLERIKIEPGRLRFVHLANNDRDGLEAALKEFTVRLETFGTIPAIAKSQAL